MIVERCIDADGRPAYFAKRNPLGGGRLQPSALWFVGEDIPYHRPAHSSPNGRRARRATHGTFTTGCDGGIGGVALTGV